MNVALEQVDESDNYALYYKPTANEDWFSFILVLKYPKLVRARFQLGWNGFRLANDKALTRLASEDKNAVQWVQNVLRKKYAKKNSVIERVANQKHIPYLVHFTNTKNLASILNIGLQPRTSLKSHNLTPHINDHLRLDGHLGALSLSIGFPNAPMFFKYRKLSAQTSWAVIVIDKVILWERRCAFCKHNAADSRISSKWLWELSTHRSLLEMFDDETGDNTRRAQRLHTYDPTDVQAEVLVFGDVPKSSILEIVVDSPHLVNTYRELAGEIPLSYEKTGRGFFSTRKSARFYL